MSRAPGDVGKTCGVSDERDHDGGGDQHSQGGFIGRVIGSVVAPVVDQVDVDEVVQRVDVASLVDQIDLDHVLDRIDVDHVLDRIDVDRLLDRVDPDRLLDRVDPDRLLDRVDPDRLLDRVDPDRLLDRVDVDRLLDRVDVNELVERTEISTIITRSTTGVFTQFLDVARTQVIGLDQVAQGVAGRLRGRGREIPPSPTQQAEPLAGVRLDPSDRAIRLQGRYAGSVSRFMAFMIDQFVIGVIFGVFALLVQTAVRVVIDSSFDLDAERVPMVIAYVLWAYTYIAGSLAGSGRTIGKAILGLRVTEASGEQLRGRSAAVRTLAFPISFFVFGIGLLVGLFRRDRRELHDLIGGTAVLYDWDAATAKRREEVLAS